MTNSTIYKNNFINIQTENSEVPWLKIFTNKPYKEFSECPFETKMEILKILDIIEKEMINYFKCDKVNIASFGNYLPHVHFHIIARFKNDTYYPECMWGEKQRKANLSLPSFEKFYETIINKLK